MKRTLVFFLVLLCGIFNADATVFVSGSISANTTWSKANSPYVVNGNLSVDSAIILTIEPGVEVRVDSGFNFNIDGTLLAQGTATDTIKFTSNKSTPSRSAWQGITFSIKGAKDTSRINYCIFEYGFMPIRNVNANVYINNSVFKYNTTAITVFGAPGTTYPYSNYTSFLTINKCLISENDTGIHDTGYRYWNIPGDVAENEISFNTVGVKSESEGGLNFTYNNLNYNAIGYWVYANGQRGSRYNTFKGNSKYAIYVTAASYNPSSNDVDRIYQNTFMYNAMAVYIEHGFVFHFYNNYFSYNDTCIEFNYSMSLNSQYNPGTHGANCFSNTKSYNLINNSTKNINMTSSWWGKSTASGIDSTIYDNKDNSSLGTINYSGYSTTPWCPTIPPPPCSQIDSVTASVTSASTAIANWNKVTGAVAYEYYVVPVSSPSPAVGTLTTDTTLNLTSLAAGTTYRVCVRTKCAAAPFASAWACDTFTTPCNAPTHITFNTIGAFNATVLWDTVAGALGYEYYIALHPSTPSSTATITTTHSTYVTGLTANTTYDFCVRTKCANTVSAWVCDTFRTLPPLVINQINGDKTVSIYPNPSNGTFNVAVTDGGYINATIIVYDMTGRMITTKPMSMGTETISLGNVAKGIYTVKVLTDNAVYTQRISIE